MSKVKSCRRQYFPKLSAQKGGVILEVVLTFTLILRLKFCGQPRILFLPSDLVVWLWRVFQVVDEGFQL
ncbi:hypothetical protein D3C78_1916460 [compost metagenome]